MEPAGTISGVAGIIQAVSRSWRKRRWISFRFSPEPARSCFWDRSPCIPVRENPVEIRFTADRMRNLSGIATAATAMIMKKGNMHRCGFCGRNRKRTLTICPQEGHFTQEDQRFFVTVVNPDGSLQSTQPDPLPAEGCRINMKDDEELIEK